MQAFMDENFLLETPTAVSLYHNTAKDLPIIDYHCHIDPRDIAEDRSFANLTELWLGGDHYKWRLMRFHGVAESLITGDAPAYDKFLAYAQVLPLAIGNPIYHWTHLELRRYFNCYELLSEATAPAIWEHCNSLLQNGLTARRIMALSHVETLVTTDDPISPLEWHQKLRAEADFAVTVRPAWRPDAVLNIYDKGFTTYVAELAKAAEQPIHHYKDLCAALHTRMDFFAEMGCVASDHGLYTIATAEPDECEASRIFEKVLAGQPATAGEVAQYQITLLHFLAAEYTARNWVFEIHYGPVRNQNLPGYRALGRDTGFDHIGAHNGAEGLSQLLSAMHAQDHLPKTILFAATPNDNQMLNTLSATFGAPGIRGRVQQGAAWWFNDTQEGMLAQFSSFASSVVFGDFLGMLTDSRSFTSYTRHEYFRRILCNFIGGKVERGEYPNQPQVLQKLVTDICYQNTAEYFGYYKGDILCN